MNSALALGRLSYAQAMLRIAWIIPGGGVPLAIVLLALAFRAPDRSHSQLMPNVALVWEGQAHVNRMSVAMIEQGKHPEWTTSAQIDQRSFRRVMRNVARSACACISRSPARSALSGNFDRGPPSAALLVLLLGALLIWLPVVVLFVTGAIVVGLLRVFFVGLEH